MRNYKKLESLQKNIGRNLKQTCFFPKIIEKSTFQGNQSVTSLIYSVAYTTVIIRKGVCVYVFQISDTNVIHYY